MERKRNILNKWGEKRNEKENEWMNIISCGLPSWIVHQLDNVEKLSASWKGGGWRVGFIYFFLKFQ